MQGALVTKVKLKLVASQYYLFIFYHTPLPFFFFFFNKASYVILYRKSLLSNSRKHYLGRVGKDPQRGLSKPRATALCLMSSADQEQNEY